MTESETLRIVRLVFAPWQNREVDPETVAHYHLPLRELSIDEALRATIQALRQPLTTPLSPGHILAAHREIICSKARERAVLKALPDPENEDRKEENLKQLREFLAGRA